MYINKEITDRTLVKIKDIRDNKCSFDDFILDTLLFMDNYKEALKLLKSDKITEKLVKVIDMNRKSHNYDKPYCMLHKSLFTLYALIMERINFWRYIRVLVDCEEKQNHFGMIIYFLQIQ
jgi:hypothetical protein